MSYGSIPVFEDVRTAGNCSGTPFQLLKKYNAPFVYVKSWSELPAILRMEKSLVLKQKVIRRQNMLSWYQQFKKKLQIAFVSKIKETFFDYPNT